MKVHWGVRDRDIRSSQGAEAFDVGRDNGQVETDWQGEKQENKSRKRRELGVLEVGLLIVKPSVIWVVRLELGPWWKERGIQISLRMTFLHRGGRALLPSKEAAGKAGGKLGTLFRT